MWTPTYHRFTADADFLAACDAAGWPRNHQNRPQPPIDVALDIIGPLTDPRLHVNAAWYCRDMDAAFSASEITPVSPSRVWS